MLKKINMIVVCSFSALTISYGIGPFLIMPILLFYICKDYKNIIYTYIPVIIVTLLFNIGYILPILFTLALTCGLSFLFMKVFKKHSILKYEDIIKVLVIAFINLGEYLLFNLKTNIILTIFTSFLSGLIYVYLDKFINKIVYHSSNTSSIIFLDSMLILISILGGLNHNVFNVNLGLLVSAYFSMYLSRSYKNIFPLIFSGFTLIVGYGIFNKPEFMFIPIISGMYLVDNVLIMLITNLILSFGVFLSNDMYNVSSILSLMGVTVIFEVINKYVIKQKKENKEVTEYIYDKIQTTSTNELLNFALFLDKFQVAFKNPKDYNQQLSDGIKSIVDNHCKSCPKSKECFKKYQQTLYPIFKSILQDNEIDEYPDFSTYCIKISSLKYTAKGIKKRLDLIPKEAFTTNNILVAQMNGFSNSIKKYVLDTNSKEELSFFELMNIKKSLEDYGLDITYFEIRKQFVDDFLIIVGIKNEKYHHIKEQVKNIVLSYIKEEISILLYKEENHNIYLHIIPKIKIDVTYGFGSLSADSVDICGDNYLIKEAKNGLFISAISDGMGKGYKAFFESDTTLRLIEDITALNISTDSALEILNTYYTMQDYLEEYATLDFLEINRYKKTAAFYKMGATTSYIFKKNGVIDKVINKHLPFGIDEEVGFFNYILDSGDLILMSSDGVIENIVEMNDFEEFIKNIKNYPPQRIVYEILNYTLSHKLKAKDDMTLIALKIMDVA